MKTIYLLLTRSQTCLSRTIHALTGDSYTHVSVAFDEALTTLCSFARYDARFPLPAGLVREQPTAGYYGAHPQIPCALVAVEVSEAGYARARGCAEAMLARQEATARRTYRYSVLGLPACRAGLPLRRKGRYFCSQFVSELLALTGDVALPGPPELMRPQELTQLPEAVCLWRGTMGELAARCAQPGLTAEASSRMMEHTDIHVCEREATRYDLQSLRVRRA